MFQLLFAEAIVLRVRINLAKCFFFAYASVRQKKIYFARFDSVRLKSALFDSNRVGFAWHSLTVQFSMCI